MIVILLFILVTPFCSTQSSRVTTIVRAKGLSLSAENIVSELLQDYQHIGFNINRATYGMEHLGGFKPSSFDPSREIFH